MAFTIIETHDGDKIVPIIHIPEASERAEYCQFLLDQGYWGWPNPNDGFSMDHLDQAGIAIFSSNKRVIPVRITNFENQSSYEILPFEAVIIPDEYPNPDAFNALI